MQRLIRGLVIGLVLAGVAMAGDTVVDGRLQVTALRDGKYGVENFKLGKAELLGYVGDQVDTKKCTGVTLKHGEQANAEQKHVIVEIAQYWKIDAFIEQGGEVKPLAAD